MVLLDDYFWEFVENFLTSNADLIGPNMNETLLIASIYFVSVLTVEESSDIFKCLCYGASYGRPSHIVLIEPTLRILLQLCGMNPKSLDSQHGKSYIYPSPTEITFTKYYELNKSYPGAEPSKLGGRGWPGIHSADMENLEEELVPAGRARVVVNLDFEHVLYDSHMCFP